MFAQVKLVNVGAVSSALIPGDALIVRSNGTQVAVVTEGDRIHFQAIEVGRDFGQTTEVRAGLSGGRTGCRESDRRRSRGWDGSSQWFGRQP